MVQYLLEIRQRLLRCSFVFLLVFGVCFYCANSLLMCFLSPLTQALPDTSSLIVTQLAAPLWVMIDVALDFAFFISAPYFLIECWHFFAPALYAHERKWIKGMCFLSLLLFILGVLFCFYIVLPWLFQFLLNYLPAHIKILPDVIYSVNFITKLLWVFGVGFQMPVVILSLIKLKVCTYQQLVAARRYVIVGVFILGMVLAPPDVLSQTLLALPFWGIYELGLLIARFGVTFTPIEQKNL